MSRLHSDGSFDNPRAKIKRSKKHMAELTAAVTDYNAQNSVEWIKEQAPNGGVSVGFCSEDGVGAPGPEFSAIVGDVIHNLRAALDLCACELARLNNPKGSDGVYFPFCDDPAYLDTMIGKKKFDRAGPDAVAFLRSLQPFKGGNKLLRALHDLDIQDKHQNLVSAWPMINSPNFSDAQVDWPIGTRLIGTIDLVFADGSDLAGEPLLNSLHDLVSMAESIVETFASLHTP